jgi:hypothetical protein
MVDTDRDGTALNKDDYMVLLSHIADYNYVALTMDRIPGFLLFYSSSSM